MSDRAKLWVGLLLAAALILGAKLEAVQSPLPTALEHLQAIEREAE